MQAAGIQQSKIMEEAYMLKSRSSTLSARVTVRDGRLME